MCTHRHRWPVLLVASVVLLWTVASDDADPPKPDESARTEEGTPKPGAENGHPRVVPLQKMEEPVESEEVPLAPDAEEALQWKALSGNLIQNGSFESGRYWPYGWDPVDNLGTFWTTGGTQGARCVRCYTDVQNNQWVEWNDKVIYAVRGAARRTEGQPQSLPMNPVPSPPERLPTAPPYYDTAAGLHGIHYRSAFIRVAPGAIYRFSVDARSDAGVPKVFIKGFIDHRRMTDEGMQVLKCNAYRAPMNLYGCDNEWRRFARLFHPARSKSTQGGKPIQPEWLRVELYAYWPPGNYYFDNVRLDVVGYEEIIEDPAESEAVPGQQETVPVTKTEDGFPVLP